MIIMSESIKRNKPSSKVLDNCDKCSKEQYEILAKICIEQVIARNWDIVVRLPHFAKYSKGFPKGILVKKEGLYDYRKIKVRKLLTWLKENGYTEFSVDDVMAATREVAYLEAAIDRMLSTTTEEN